MSYIQSESRWRGQRKKGGYQKPIGRNSERHGEKNQLQQEAQELEVERSLLFQRNGRRQRTNQATA